ncbi:MAG TPA: hypothetical protein DF613_12835 [Lachnospiraceae bacterium]|nr:hypothetical protein [Lachnospiraceae bacterium]
MVIALFYHVISALSILISAIADFCTNFCLLFTGNIIYLSRHTPVETFGGILIHDHEACFYSYGSDHQECMVHIERYLKDSIENEKNLTWNGQMPTLIQCRSTPIS